MTGFNSKREAAADKLQEPDEALTLEALKYAASMGYRLRGTKFGPFTIKEGLDALPKREWVGLNKEEAFELQVKHKDKPFSLSAAVENLLREKNQ